MIERENGHYAAGDGGISTGVELVLSRVEYREGRSMVPRVFGTGCFLYLAGGEAEHGS